MNEYSLPKTKTPVSPSEIFQKWIKKKMMEKKFASVSHAVEYALEELRKKRSQYSYRRSGQWSFM